VTIGVFGSERKLGEAGARKIIADMEREFRDISP